MNFKERLKALRKEARLNQTETGNILGYRYTAISNYESGRNEPSISDLKKLAKFFNVSMDYLLCINDIRNPYVATELPENFEEIKNIYISLSGENRKELELFANWLQSKEEALSKPAEIKQPKQKNSKTKTFYADQSKKEAAFMPKVAEEKAVYNTSTSKGKGKKKS